MAWDIAAMLIKAVPWLLIFGGAAHVAQQQLRFVDNKLFMGITVKQIIGATSVAAGIFALMA